MNNLYATYDTITPEYVLAGCKQMLGIKNSTEDDLYILDLINEGVKSLRSPLNFIPAIATLQIVGGKAKLPDGFVSFPRGKFPIRYVQANGFVDPTLANFTAPLFTNNPFYTQDPFTGFASLAPFNGIVNMANGYLFFEGETDVDFVKIAYMSTNLDYDGNVVIPAVTERAAKAYAGWKYSRTIKDYPAASSYEYEYKKCRTGLRGRYNLLQSYEELFVQYVVNSLP